MKNEKPILEYDFFKLLIATMITNDYIPLIKRYKLQEDLFEFGDLDEFKLLFFDLIRKDNIDYKYVDLSSAFIGAYAYGLITMYRDGENDAKYLIQIDSNIALKILEKYTDEEKDAMNNLVNKLREKENIKVLKKTNKN